MPECVREARAEGPAGEAAVGGPGGRQEPNGAVPRSASDAAAVAAPSPCPPLRPPFLTGTCPAAPSHAFWSPPPVPSSSALPPAPSPPAPPSPPRPPSPAHPPSAKPSPSPPPCPSSPCRMATGPAKRHFCTIWVNHREHPNVTHNLAPTFFWFFNQANSTRNLSLEKTERFLLAAPHGRVAEIRFGQWASQGPRLHHLHEPQGNPSLTHNFKAISPPVDNQSNS